MDLFGYIKQNRFGYKDLVKFKPCTKLISQGVKNSSSDLYSNHSKANTGEYVKEDIVGVSVNGKRANRISFNKNELLKAIDKKVTIITDNQYDRNRSFNIGERELAEFLTANNYIEVDEGIWKIN